MADFKTTPKQEKRLSTTTEMYRGHFIAAWKGESRSRAIKAMCLECVGFERKAVTECAATACPLWRYRPYQNSQTLQEVIADLNEESGDPDLNL